MTPDTAPEAITQADREAAFYYYDTRTGDNNPLVQAFARHRRLTAHSAGEGLREALGQALAWAYTQGATDVHEEWGRDPDDRPRGDPDFAEAASDYAKAALDPFSSAARVPPEVDALLTPPSDAGSTTRSGGEGDGLLVWLASKPRLSLDHFGPVYGDDDDQSEGWKVTREGGPINDREWEVVAKADTPIAALIAARAVVDGTPSPDASPDSGEAIPAGMKPWAGGSTSPPADWDGGPVQYRTGAVDVAVDDWSRAGIGTDIVAYTPRRPSSSPAIVKEAGEVERALHEGEWFYPEGDHSSDECRFSPDEVIDYALEGENVSRVVAIERAAALPTVYAAVRVYSDAEKDARGSDDEYDYTLFATAEEAGAALSASNAAQVSK